MPTIKELVDKIKQFHINLLGQYDVPIETSQIWNEGASIEEIIEIEMKYDITLPPDLKEWFLEINGQPNSSFPFFFGDSPVTSLKDFEEEIADMPLRPILKNETLKNVESVPKDSIYPRYGYGYGSGLITMAQGGQDDYLAIDLIPNINGTYGQVIIYGYSWEDNYPFHVVFESWKEYLINFINDYENKHELEVELVHQPGNNYEETNGYRYRVLNGHDCYFYDLYQEILGFKRHVDD